MNMGLASLIGPDLIFPYLGGSDRPTVLRDLAERVAAAGRVDDADRLYGKLWEREQLGSTGIGSGVAVPHCKMKGIDRPVMAVGVTPKAIDFGAVDGKPVAVFFLVVSPEDEPAEHLRALAEISRWARADRHVERLRKADGADAIFELLRREGG
jgi:PTS system nitrogen regulatory IIA component